MSQPTPSSLLMPVALAIGGLVLGLISGGVWIAVAPASSVAAANQPAPPVAAAEGDQPPGQPALASDPNRPTEPTELLAAFLSLRYGTHLESIVPWLPPINPGMENETDHEAPRLHGVWTKDDQPHPLLVNVKNIKLDRHPFERIDSMAVAADIEEQDIVSALFVKIGYFEKTDFRRATIVYAYAGFDKHDRFVGFYRFAMR